MAKLNQIIAIQNGSKTRAKDTLTAAYHQIQKTDTLSGIARRYTPKDDEGEKLPPESKLVQVRVQKLIDTVKAELTALIDIVATQDTANCFARADVTVNGVTILKAVPVTHLLFLEKQVIDIHTFVEKLPTLDPGERWTFDAAQDCYASDPSQSSRSKKVMRNHVKAEATKEHPAQVDTYFEDVIVGTWTTTKFSGAISVADKNLLLVRIRQLSDAIKAAREEANNMEAASVSYGAALVDFVFSN